MPTLIDSYSESNQDSATILNSYIRYIGQSFTGSGNYLDSCKFYLKKSGSPTGSAYAQLYAHTGTFGSTGQPADLSTPLAVSDAFNVATLTTSYQLITFNFTGANRYEMTNGTKYFLVFSHLTSDSTNYVSVGDDASSPSHGGNETGSIRGEWAAQSLIDTCFYVYKTTSTLVDSYSETNYSGDYIQLFTDYIEYVGQSFTATAGNLESCKFYIAKSGSPTGSAYAELYAHTGTFGSTGVPTGSPLATSDAFSVSTLTTSLALTTFNFTGINQYTMVADTKYFIVLRYNGGNNTNYIYIGLDATSPSHAGCYVRAGGWFYDAAYDTCFYVYDETTSTSTTSTSTSTTSTSTSTTTTTTSTSTTTTTSTSTTTTTTTISGTTTSTSTSTTSTSTTSTSTTTTSTTSTSTTTTTTTTLPPITCTPIWDSEYNAIVLPEDHTPAWTRDNSGGLQEIAPDGFLHNQVNEGGDGSWYQYYIDDIFSQAINSAVEIKIKILSVGEDDTILVYFFNESNTIYLRFFEDRVSFYTIWGSATHYIDTTDDYHVYRIIYNKDNLEAYLYVDGVYKKEIVCKSSPGGSRQITIYYENNDVATYPEGSIDYIYTGCCTEAMTTTTSTSTTTTSTTSTSTSTSTTSTSTSTTSTSTTTTSTSTSTTSTSTTTTSTSTTTTTTSTSTSTTSTTSTSTTSTSTSTSTTSTSTSTTSTSTSTTTTLSSGRVITATRSDYTKSKRSTGPALAKKHY